MSAKPPYVVWLIVDNRRLADDWSAIRLSAHDAEDAREMYDDEDPRGRPHTVHRYVLSDTGKQEQP